MSLDTYKKQVYLSMLKVQKVTIQEADKLMKLYAEDFQEFLDDNLTPVAAAGGMVIYYL
jgi:hypothetical protein